jgi:hypothetical protein
MLMGTREHPVGIHKLPGICKSKSVICFVIYGWTHLNKQTFLAAKNGIYISLVKDVQDAFEANEIAKVDCEGLNPSDYKKIGAKLRVLFISMNLFFSFHYKEWK